MVGDFGLGWGSGWVFKFWLGKWLGFQIFKIFQILPLRLLLGPHQLNMPDGDASAGTNVQVNVTNIQKNLYSFRDNLFANHLRISRLLYERISRWHENPDWSQSREIDRITQETEQQRRVLENKVCNKKAEFETSLGVTLVRPRLLWYRDDEPTFQHQSPPLNQL